MTWEDVDFKDTGCYDPCAVDGDEERPKRTTRKRSASVDDGGDPSPTAAETSHKQAAGRKRPGCLGSLCGWLGFVLGLVVAVGCFSRFLPAPFDALPFMPILIAGGPWYALLAVVALVFALIGWRNGVAIAMVCCILMQVVWQVPYWVGEPRPEPAPDQFGTVAVTRPVATMSLNTYFGNADAHEIVDLVASEGIEILCLQEVTPELTDALKDAGLMDLLPHFVGRTEGNQIWSAYPLEDPVLDAVGYSGSHMPAATVELDGLRVRVVSVHTCAPIPGYEDLWSTSLTKVAHIAQNDHPAGAFDCYLLMGDFNATYDHASLREIAQLNGLFDAERAAGEGLKFTWPSTGESCLVAIDHMLVDSAMAVHSIDVRYVSGTDHLAIVVELGVAAGPMAVAFPSDGVASKNTATAEEPMSDVAEAYSYTVDGTPVNSIDDNDDWYAWVWLDGKKAFLLEEGSA